MDTPGILFTEDKYITEFDRLIGYLEDTVNSLEKLYSNIDSYDRHSASAIIATNAGMVRGIVLRLNELKG